MIEKFDYIKQGDCLELMKDVPDRSIDCIVADLPYGTTACSWDIIIPFEPLWEQYERIVKDNGAIVLFATEPFATELRHSNLKMYKYDWIWKKNKPTGFQHAKNKPLANYENICVFSKGVVNHKKFSCNRMEYNPQGLEISNKVIKKANKFTSSFNLSSGINGKEYIQEYSNYPRQIIEFDKDSPSLHTAQKPLALLEYLIKTYTNEDETVLDNCMGSGSTCIAAMNTNRHYIGFELDENYFNIAKERIEKNKLNIKQ